MSRVRMTEKECSAACKRMLAFLGADSYSTESGYVVQTDRHGRVVPRKGGTRTTPGIPDLLVHYPIPTPDLVPPEWDCVFVEVKGADTAVREEQWEFTRKCMERGFVSLIVRSHHELLAGLDYFDLLPERASDWGSEVWDRTQWPENMNFLPDMFRHWQSRLFTVSTREPAIVPDNRRRRP